MIRKLTTKYSFRFLVFLVFLLSFFGVYEYNNQKDERIIKEQICKLDMVYSSIDQSNWVMWVKDKDFKLIYVSSSFVNLFGKPYGMTKETFEGKYDREIFDSITAKGFVKDDKSIKDCFCDSIFYNNFVQGSDSIFFTSTKYPYVYSNGKDTGVAGYGNFIKKPIE